MKLEVGMYVRFEGKIRKIIEIEDKDLVFDDDWFDHWADQINRMNIDRFIKDYYPIPTFNILDLIEVGDILSFYEDIDNYKKQYAIRIPDLITLDEMKDKIENGNIRLISILTKEIMEDLEYMVEEYD